MMFSHCNFVSLISGGSLDSAVESTFQSYRSLIFP